VFGGKRPQFQMTLDQCLLAAMVRNPQVQEKDLPDGRIELSLPYRKPWVVRVFSRKDRKTFLRRFELDDIGADLWRRIDDKRTVADLVGHLERTRNLAPQQATESMISYVHMLMTRGLVGLVLQEQA
jgi:hypothetical protein